MADEHDSTTAQAPDDGVRRAYDDGFAAASRGEEAAPGCTTNAQGRAFLRGYVAGRKALGAAARTE
jgi:hypothetical protein